MTLLNADHQQLRDAIFKQCKDFGDDYWLARDRDAAFPADFYHSMADAGWLGIAMPGAYGGSGLGITEAALIMQAIAESGAGMSGASAIHINIFGLNPVVVFGTEEQKKRMLPPLIGGLDKACFAVTEPNAGHNTAEISTRADRQSDGSYVISGEKIWISTAQVANKMLILARTTPLDRVRKKLDGMSLFYTDLDRSKIEVRLIHKMGRHAIDSNMLFIDGLVVPEQDRIGEEGKGFQYILHGLNPERILLAAEAVGIGRAAIQRASQYAEGSESFWPSDRAESSDCASPRPLLGSIGSRQPDDVRGCEALRPGTPLRNRSERGQVPGRRICIHGLRARRSDTGRHGIRAGVSRRAAVPGMPDSEDRTYQQPDDPELPE